MTREAKPDTGVEISYQPRLLYLSVPDATDTNPYLSAKTIHLQVLHITKEMLSRPDLQIFFDDIFYLHARLIIENSSHYPWPPFGRKDLISFNPDNTQEKKYLITQITEQLRQNVLCEPETEGDGSYPLVGVVQESSDKVQATSMRFDVSLMHGTALVPIAFGVISDSFSLSTGYEHWFTRGVVDSTYRKRGVGTLFYAHSTDYAFKSLTSIGLKRPILKGAVIVPKKGSHGIDEVLKRYDPFMEVFDAFDPDPSCPTMTETEALRHLNDPDCLTRRYQFLVYELEKSGLLPFLEGSELALIKLGYYLEYTNLMQCATRDGSILPTRVYSMFNDLWTGLSDEAIQNAVNYHYERYTA